MKPDTSSSTNERDTSGSSLARIRRGGIREGGQTYRIDPPAAAAPRYRFHFDQENLELLCADRKLRTSEIHESNDFYGQASVLKRYSGLPERYRLKAVLEHAPVIHDNMWDHDRDTMLPVNLCCSPQRAAVLRECSGRPSQPVGFGYLYAQRLVDKFLGARAENEERFGTLVFPFKSTHFIETKFDHVDYARRLRQLPSYMMPIAVCIFWKDYLRGAHRAYQDAGFRIVTAGHMFDRDFLLRLHDVCRQFRYAVSNEFGSQLFLSVASGCRFFYLSSSPITRDVPNSQRPNYVRDNPGFQRIRGQSFRLFDRPVEEVSKLQRDFVDGILGKHCVRPPGELRRILLSAELRDKLAPLRLAGEIGWSAYVPASWRRGLSRIGRLRNSISKRLSTGPSRGNDQ